MLSQELGLCAGEGKSVGKQERRGRATVGLAGFAVAIVLSGCGAQYRPVVSAINPVGPAGQPSGQFAVALSNTSGIPLQSSITAYSIASNVATFTVPATNPFLPGQTLTLSGFTTSAFLNGTTVTVLATGFSATQFEANLPHADVALTAEAGTALLPGNVQPGLLTFIDVSGDSVLSTPSVLPFPAPINDGTATVAPTPTYVNPLNFSLTLNGGQGFIVNDTGNFEDFFTSNPTSLLTQDIVPTTLAPGVVPSGVQAYTLNGGSALFIPEPNVSQISELSVGNGASLIQNLFENGLINPTYVVGTDSAPRLYAIDPGNGTTAGQVFPIENSPVSLSTPITVGTNPVYGVMTPDGNRAFILNKGSGTVSVINVPSNAADITTPTITLPNLTTGGPAAPNPVWADFVPLLSEMVVLNQGDGVHPGSLSIISIPLCNPNSPVNPVNPNCNPLNPVDALGFGTIVRTVPVGINPTMVSVLNDNSYRAYVVNSGALPNGSSPGVDGSVSVVDLNSGVVLSTINAVSSPLVTQSASDPGTSSPALVYGHPNTIATTAGTPAGKVYVTSTDNEFVTVIKTDTDTVHTHISLQGLGIRVLTTSK